MTEQSPKGNPTIFLTNIFCIDLAMVLPSFNLPRSPSSVSTSIAFSQLTRRNHCNNKVNDTEASYVLRQGQPSLYDIFNERWDYFLTMQLSFHNIHHYNLASHILAPQDKSFRHRCLLDEN